MVFPNLVLLHMAKCKSRPKCWGDKSKLRAVLRFFSWIIFSLAFMCITRRQRGSGETLNAVN